MQKKLYDQKISNACHHCHPTLTCCCCNQFFLIENTLALICVQAVRTIHEQQGQGHHFYFTKRQRKISFHIIMNKINVES